MLSDFFRFWWAALYWNVRKSAFVLRGTRGPAPCQNPSDSGRAGATACEACLHWRRPQRFRAVCPVLVETAQGCRCSVDAAGVRPWWGRALAAGAVAGVVLWMAGTLAAWGGLRMVGYRELRYWDFWSLQFPARWRAAQADYYRHQSAAAFAAGDFSRGLMALAVAYDRNPSDFEAGLLLAQLFHRTRQAERGDRLFERLLHDFPTRAERLDLAWSDALLARENHAALAALATRQVATGTGTARWVRTLVFALRHLDEAGFAAVVDHAEAAMPERLREIMTAERRLRAGDRAAVRAQLTAPTLASDPIAIFYRVETLQSLGALDEAAVILRQGTSLLGKFHANLLAYRLAVGKDDGPGADRLFDRLVQAPLIPEKVEWLGAELLRGPSRARMAALFAAVAEADGLQTRGEVQVALLVAAASCDDASRVAQVIARSRELSPGAELGLKRLAVYLRGGAEAEPLPVLIETLPVSREIVYALLETRRVR